MAERGNPNWLPGVSGNADGGRRPKKFQMALDRALAADDGKRLRACVETVLTLASQGERWAVELLRDTLDGRPQQSIVAQDDLGRELAIGLVAYALPAPTSIGSAVRSDDTLPVLTAPVSTPDIEGTGQRH